MIQRSGGVHRGHVRSPPQLGLVARVQPLQVVEGDLLVHRRSVLEALERIRRINVEIDEVIHAVGQELMHLIVQVERGCVEQERRKDVSRSPGAPFDENDPFLGESEPLFELGDEDLELERESVQVGRLVEEREQVPLGDGLWAAGVVGFELAHQGGFTGADESIDAEDGERPGRRVGTLRLKGL